MISTPLRSFIQQRIGRFTCALLLLFALQGITACQTQRIEEREDHLAAAGFIVLPANTPERVAMLKRLPAHQFVRRVHGDVVHYVYADPLVCGCLYVGTQQAYGQYVRDRQQQQLADQQQMAAQEYSDAAWNWNAWGPWGPAAIGPWGPGVGFVYEQQIGW